MYLLYPNKRGGYENNTSTVLWFMMNQKHSTADKRDKNKDAKYYSQAQIKNKCFMLYSM